MIYVPRYFPELTKETLLQEVQSDFAVQIDQTQYAHLHQMSQKKKAIELEVLKHASETRIPVRLLCHKKYDPFNGLKKFIKHVDNQTSTHHSNSLEETKEANSNHNNDSPNPRKKNGKWLLDAFRCGTGNSNRFQNARIKSNFENAHSNVHFKELVIHIHGGGFVSMSSGSHQNYTRRWARMLKRPVFSIDYRLAPENPFPAAVDDCWQFYNWILAYGKEVLGRFLFSSLHFLISTSIRSCT